jgi:hypothetical protein
MDVRCVQVPLEFGGRHRRRGRFHMQEDRSGAGVGPAPRPARPVNRSSDSRRGSSCPCKGTRRRRTHSRRRRNRLVVTSRERSSGLLLCRRVRPARRSSASYLLTQRLGGYYTRGGHQSHSYRPTGTQPRWGSPLPYCARRFVRPSMLAGMFELRLWMLEVARVAAHGPENDDEPLLIV